jgi:integrase
MGKLTDVQIRQWIKARQPVAKADGGGLTFTLSAKGTAAWVVRYRFGGKARELSIGRYPDITLAKARELATEARAKIQQGGDVAREKQIANIERAAAKSLRELATDYMANVFPTLAANTIRQRRQHIEGVILPKLGGLSARDVTTSDVVFLIKAVGAKSKNVAGLVFTAVSEIFKYGIANHAVSTNPCAGIAVAAICGRAEPARQRLKLTAEELRTIFPELPFIGAENALAVKLQLATCVRLGELARAKWVHVDFDGTAKWTQPNGDPIETAGPQWLIPVENSKTGKTTKKHFAIPLAPAAVGWLKELQTLACGSPYVLPARQLRRKNSHGGDVHFEQRALNAMLHNLCDKLGDKVRRFTPHDLRSTARSHLAALGVNVLVAERCLNHSLGGLIGIYDQHDYMSERRAALELWAEFILACEAGREWRPKAGNVIPLHPAAA